MDKEITINGQTYRLVEEEPIYEFNGLLWTKTFPRRPWQEAIEFCQNLNYGGYNDWRLATRFELESLLDLEMCNPACSLPDTLSASYWSSNTYAANPDYAWDVLFNSGYVGYNGDKSNELYVRAVRDGKGK